MRPSIEPAAARTLRPCGITTVAQRGFTLIEMLVVLLVMGLLAGLVTVSSRPDDRALLALEGERLAQLLDLAATESRYTGKRLAWTADGAGYSFSRFDDMSGWVPIVDDALRARTLPPGITISALQIDNLRTSGQMRLQFDPRRAGPSFNLGMSLGEARCTVAGSPIGEVRVLAQEASGNETLRR